MLGSHTAGKSSLVRRFQIKQPKALLVDTDREISHDFGGNLYNVFLALTVKADSTMAAALIEQRERELLRQLQQLDRPCLIAAGPLIPTREPEWSEFLHAVSPVCFFFRLSAVDMYTGLKRRRGRHRASGMASILNFGSWDHHLATQYNPETETWDSLTEIESLPLIEAFLSQVNPVYEKACQSFRIYDSANVRGDKRLQRDLEEAFEYYLDAQPATKPVPAPALAEAKTGASRASILRRGLSEAVRTIVPSSCRGSDSVLLSTLPSMELVRKCIDPKNVPLKAPMWLDNFDWNVDTADLSTVK